MAFIVTESCIECKHTDCVEVCPVDCFYEGENFLVINPDEGIDPNISPEKNTLVLTSLSLIRFII